MMQLTCVLLLTTVCVVYSADFNCYKCGGFEKGGKSMDMDEVRDQTKKSGEQPDTKSKVMDSQGSDSSDIDSSDIDSSDIDSNETNSRETTSSEERREPPPPKCDEVSGNTTLVTCSTQCVKLTSDGRVLRDCLSELPSEVIQGADCKQPSGSFNTVDNAVKGTIYCCNSEKCNSSTKNVASTLLAVVLSAVFIANTIN